MADEKRELLKQAYDRAFLDENIQKEQMDSAKRFEGVGSKGGQEW